MLMTFVLILFHCWTSQVWFCSFLQLVIKRQWTHGLKTWEWH